MKSKEWDKWALQTSAWSRVEGLIALKVTALEESMDNFWESRKSLTHLQLKYIYQVIKNKVQEENSLWSWELFVLKMNTLTTGKYLQNCSKFGRSFYKSAFFIKKRKKRKTTEQHQLTSLRLCSKRSSVK